MINLLNTFKNKLIDGKQKDIGDNINNNDDYTFDEFDPESKDSFRFSDHILNLQKEIEQLEEKLNQLKEKQENVYKLECQDKRVQRGLYWQLKTSYHKIMLPLVSIEDGKFARFQLDQCTFNATAMLDNGYKIIYKLSCKVPLTYFKELKITDKINAWEFRKFVKFKYIKTVYQQNYITC